MLSTTFRSLPLPSRLGLVVVLACSAATAPVLAQDRTCSRMKALTVSATTGFTGLSGPEVARDASWTTVEPTQDLVPMMGECRLRTPAQANEAKASLTCATPLKVRTSDDLVKDTGVLATEFGKCLGTSVQREVLPASATSGHRHLWVLDGPAERPWQLTLALVVPQASSGEASEGQARHFEMVLTSKATAQASGK